MTRSRDARTTRLTKRSVDAARPETGRYIVWDDDLAGFGLRVEPTGRKTFLARYRAGGGRSGILRQATIGRFGTLTADEARIRAKRLLGKAAGGGDPLGDKKRAQQTGATIAEICDWYLKEATAGRLVGRRGRPIKASTLASDRSRIETHVRPLIGRRPVSALTVADLEAMQADIAAGKTAASPKAGKNKGKRAVGGVAAGGSGVGARTLGMVQAILEHARRAGRVSANPAKGARMLARKKRVRRLSLDEVRALGKAIRESKNGNPVALAAVRFALLSGFRRLEVLSIRGNQVLPAGGVDLPDSKSGPQVRPVGQSAIGELKTRLAQTINDDDWLFPAGWGSGHFVGLPKVLARLCAAAKLTGVSMHTLRHSFASIAADLGYSELVIAGLLGHSAGSVTSGYVHLDSALVSAADRVSATIARALSGESKATVVRLKKTTA
jgi:integrase